MNFLRALIEAYRRWYRGEIARQRRMVEEDARRLNSKVIWND
jgi:hypothetical protein